MDNQNPLMQYTRQPKIYVKMPSGGNFNDPDTFPFSVDREIPIFAMTAHDELMLKTPDALLNGESLVKVISSCVPQIKNVKNLCVNDIGVILLAIRYASYGTQMDMEAECSHCGHKNEFGIDLHWVLSNISELDQEYKLVLSNDMTVYIRPWTFESSLKKNIMQFNEQKLLKSLLDTDMSDEKKDEAYKESFKKIAALTVELCADSILKITDPKENEIKADSDQIFEWISNIPAKDAHLIQNKITEINNLGVPSHMDITCSECGKDFKTEITFDPSHFFE